MNPWIIFQNAHFLALSRWLLAAVFLASAWGKLRRPLRFTSVVAAFRLLPGAFVRPFALALPWLEAGLGLALLAGWQMRIAAALSAALLLAFILAMGINLARGRTNLDCGCFGARSRHTIGARLIDRNLLLMLLAAALAANGSGFLALDGLPDQAKRLLFDTLLAQAALPLALTGAGLWTTYRLWIQLGRLMSLAPLEREP